MNLPANVIQAIRDAATTHKIEAELVAAFVAQESGGRRYLSRYEPFFKYYANPIEYAKATGVTGMTENVGQSTSWGLMQVMGARARELGYRGLFPELCDIDLGLYYGCRDLVVIAERYHLDVKSPLTFTGALACAYNHGHPETNPNGSWVVQEYVDSLKHFYDSFAGEL